MTRQRVCYEHGQPVQVITWWADRGPRNVLIQRGDGTQVVRPLRGPRGHPPARDPDARRRSAKPGQ